MYKNLLLICLADTAFLLALYLVQPNAAFVFTSAAALLTGGIYAVAWASEQIEPTRVNRLFFSGLGVSAIIFGAFAIFFYYIV